MADPRPYNYQYRRPRDNRTYQSYNAYQSLYHMGKVQQSNYGNNFMGDHYSSRVNRYAPVQQSPYSSNIAQQAHYESYKVQPETHQNYRNYESIGINTDRYSNSNKSESNRSVKSRSSSMSAYDNPPQPQGRNSILSTYGSSSIPHNQSNHQIPANSMKKQPVTVVYSNHQDTAKIYSKQQKPFDIINLYSRPSEPLRKYPKLTMEHLILEKGMDLAS